VLNFATAHLQSYALCVWIHVDHLQESSLAVVAALAELAARAGGAAPSPVEPAQAVQRLGALLRAHPGGKLVVLDNADTVAWSELAPLAESGHVVVTTRNRELLENATPGGVIELAPFTEAEALQLLDVPADTECAVDLVHALGCLPLAVEHARCSMAQHAQRPADVLATLRTVEASAGNVDREDLVRAYSVGVLASFELSVRNAAAACEAQLGAAAGPILRRTARMCGYLHAERIPRWFLQQWVERISGLTPEEAGVVVENLVQFSLLAPSGTEEGTLGPTFEMHRIVQAAMRAQDGTLRQLPVLLRAMERIFHYDDNGTVHTATEQLAPHVDACTAHGRAAAALLPDEAMEHLAALLGELSRWYGFRALYQKASAGPPLRAVDGRPIRRWRRRRPISSWSASPARRPIRT
jgi:hypothetical protein